MKAGTVTAFWKKNSQFKSSKTRKLGELAYQLELATYQIKDYGGLTYRISLMPRWPTADGLSLL